MTRSLIAVGLLSLGLGMAIAPAVEAAGLQHSQQRAARQQARIAHGVGQGQIGPRENAWLQRGQNRVAMAQSRAAADGVVNRGEWRHINAMQNRQSRHIYWARHNQ